MTLVVTSYSSGVDFGTSTTDKTWTAGDAAIGNDTTTSYRNLTIPAGVTMTLGLRSILKISGTLTVAGTILGSQTGTGSGTGNDGLGTKSYKSGTINMTAGDGGGGGGHRFAGGTTRNVNDGGGNVTAGGGSYNYVTTLGLTSSFSAQLQSGSMGGSGHGAGSGAAGGGPGYGGGSFRIMARDIIVNGEISAAGQQGGSGTGGSYEDGGGGGGGGSGGTVWIVAGRVSGAGRIHADGGYSGANGTGKDGANGTAGGGGSCGFVRLDIGIWGTTTPTITSRRWTAVDFGNNYEWVSSVVTTGSLITAVDDTTGPTIGTPVLSFPNGAGQYQNQIVTVPVSDSQTVVNVPSAAFETVSGTNSGSVSTSFLNGTATFTVSNQTGSGTARLGIWATDQAGNTTIVYSPAWTIDNTAPQNYVPFFGSGTTDWILDGRTPPSGITLSGTTYTITAASDPTQSYSYNLKNLTIASTYSLFWRGQLILKVNTIANINGLLGQASVNPNTYGSGFSGGFRGGRAGFSSMPSESLPNFTDWGEKGYGWDSSLSYGANGGTAGYRPPNDQVDNVGAGGGGSHLAKIPLANDTYSSVVARGAAPGNGGGGGGGGGDAGGTWQGGGMGGHGGAGCILYAQTLSGTGSIDCSGSMGAQGIITSEDRRDGAPGGGGAGGHVIVITGTTSFSGNIKSKGAVSQSTQANSSWTGSGGPGGDGYVNWYYNSKSTDPTFSPAAINTTKIDSTIPATVNDNQPAATSALLTSSFRKSTESQTITIIYSKQMTNSEVKITITGAQTVAQITMTAGTNNTYTYTHVNTAGNGVVNYSIVGKDLLLNPAQTISGSWILDNTAPTITSSITPSRAYFFPGEKITYSVAVTESNNILTTPSMVINKGTGYAGPDPSAATLSLSSFDRTSVYGYQSSVQLPFGVGSVNASVTATDLTGNLATTTNLSPVKIIPPSGSFSY